MDWKTSENMLFAVLSAFAKGQKRADFSRLSPTFSDWEELFSVAEEQQILPVVYEMVYDLPELASYREKETDGVNVGEKKMQALGKGTVRTVLRQALRAERFYGQYDALTAEGIAPVIVKGLVLRDLYEKGDHRVSGDEDILVSDEDFKKAIPVFQSEGYRALGEIKEDLHELGWMRDKDGSHIELHRTLFGEDYTLGREIGGLMEGAYGRRVGITLKNGKKVWTLSPADHFLYLILHAYKHFVGPGVGIRQVMDIGVFGRKYVAEIDWQKLYDDLQSVRAAHFAAALFDICRKELDLPVAETAPWTDLSVDGVPLLKDMLGAGLCGNVSMERLHTATITLNQVEADRTGTKSSVWKSAFPPREKLVGTYPELKDKPWRLPAVWVKRLWKYRKETKQQKNNDTKETLRLGKERTELLRMYKIIE